MHSHQCHVHHFAHLYCAARYRLEPIANAFALSRHCRLCLLEHQRSVSCHKFRQCCIFLYLAGTHFRPRIVTGLTPVTGSFTGGNLVTITGDGFSNVASQNTVTLGSVPCDVQSASQSSLVCLTGAGSAQTCEFFLSYCLLS